MRKAIAIDLDGTLLTSSGSITKTALNALASLETQGWIIVIATARPVRSLRRIVPPWFERFYWATCNGAWVMKDDKVLRRAEMPYREARAVAAQFIAEGFVVSVEASDMLYTDEDFSWSDYRPLSKFVDMDACNVLVSARDGYLTRAFEMVPETFRVVVTDRGTLAQIAQPDCCKSNAVDYILRREGLTFADLTAFGDDHNDVPLLRAAGCGVAMANAAPEVQAAADVVACANDDDGVGLCLHALLTGSPLPRAHNHA